MSVLVLKFGGTSVSKKSNWDNISFIIQERLKRVDKVLIVCSALSGISTKLENLTQAAATGPYQDKLLEIKTIHEEMCRELGIDFESILGKRFKEFEKLLSGVSILSDAGPKNWARILSFGEIFSTLLGSAYLEKCSVPNEWLDVRDFILASEYEDGSLKKRYLEAICECSPDAELQNTLLMQKKKSVFVTQGFIARNVQGETVLLGRGGSDVSASYLAAKLQSPWLEIWTDVPGMFTANPKAIPQARLLKELSYDEAQEIASSGAKVLHPRCIAPVQISKIPLHVYSTERPDLLGTIISDRVHSAPRVKAISLGLGTTVISMNTLGMWQQAGFLANAFSCFKKWGLSINQVSTAETNVTVALDTKTNHMDKEVLEGLLQDLSQYCQVDVITGCATVALVGKNIRHIFHELAPAFKTFEEHKIYMLSQSSTDLNLTCVVDEAQAERLSKELHQFFFKEDLVDPTFGPMWSELFQTDTKFNTSFVNEWWKSKKELLLQSFSSEKTPAYVYSLNEVSKACERLRTIRNIDRFLYAVKANNNEPLLREIEKHSMGFECVSLEEVFYILKLFPSIDKKRILFTPNFAPQIEYVEAFKLGIHVTLDGLYPLEVWPNLFKGKDVFIRVDLGIGRGHHRFVCTAGNESKFGVPLHQMSYLKDLTLKNKTQVIGLHAHAGSGILTSKNWFEMGQALLGIVEDFPSVKFIDLGGGLGVPYKRGDRLLDLEHVSKSLDLLQEKKGSLEFWMEPGRYVVADAGVLLAKVTQIKPKGDQFYIGIEAGMNSLIRPALYGAYHEIVNLSRLGDSCDMVCNIVGPICESGDVLGTTRKLPSTTKEGDLILVATAGAYGKVMGSFYTMRPPASEYVL